MVCTAASIHAAVYGSSATLREWRSVGQKLRNVQPTPDLQGSIYIALLNRYSAKILSQIPKFTHTERTPIRYKKKNTLRLHEVAAHECRSFLDCSMWSCARRILLGDGFLSSLLQAQVVEQGWGWGRNWEHPTSKSVTRCCWYLNCV